MRTAETMALLNDLEQRFPVATWTIGDLHVWPMARERIAWWCNDDLAGTRTAAGADSPVQRRLRRARRLATALSARAAQAALDREHEARTDRAADLLFLGDALSRVELDGRWYDRICDPIADAAARIGRTTVQLEPNHVYRRPRHRAARSIQPELDALWLRARARPPRAARHLPAHDDAMDSLARRGLDPAPFSAEAIERTWAYVTVIASWFERVLARVQPSAVFVVDYNATSWALAAACRRRGIPSIELQHGLQGDLHWAYGSWSAVPAGGYEVLPSIYWTWSDDDAATIEAWAGQIPGRPHRAVVGGNAWLAGWKANGDLALRHDQRLAPLLADGAERRVLWTLQAGLTGPAALRQLGAAVDAAPDDWSWWVRTHPAMSPSEIAAARQVVAGRPRATIELPSREPLPALLRHADVHVTESSSSVFDAASFGVPSVLTDASAAAHFEPVARRGLLTTAADVPTLIDALATARHAEAAPTTRSTDEVLAALLAEVSR